MPLEPNPIATILLVEDDMHVRDATARMLRSDGYRVLEAVDGSDARRVSNSFQDDIDVLLTDVLMPRLAGPELAAELRGRRPHLRVIFFSGQAIERTIAAGQALGALALAKPFSREQLLAQVRAALEVCV
ncbi:MAG: response regulator [Phycisphaerae bacterium]